MFIKIYSQDPDDSDSCIVGNFVPGRATFSTEGQPAPPPTPIAGSATDRGTKDSYAKRIVRN